MPPIRRQPGNNYLYAIRRKRLPDGFSTRGWMGSRVRCVWCSHEFNAAVPIRNAVALDCPECERSRCVVGIPMQIGN